MECWLVFGKIIRAGQIFDWKKLKKMMKQICEIPGTKDNGGFFCGLVIDLPRRKKR